MLTERNHVAFIADDQTILGFSLTGLENPKEEPLFYHVSDTTPEEEIVRIYKNLVVREDVAIIFVNDFVMRKIRHILNEDLSALPSVVELPCRDND